MGLSVRGPGIFLSWKRYRRICGPSGSASNHQGLSYLEKTTYTQHIQKLIRKVKRTVSGLALKRIQEITENTKGELVLTLTLGFRFDQVEHLAEQILEGQRFDAHFFHPLTLFLIKILQLKHGQDTIAIRVHAAKPVLYTGARNGKCTQIEHVTAGWYVTHFLDRKKCRNLNNCIYSCILPGGIFLVFLRNQEPNELSVAHPTFSLHSITSGNNSYSHSLLPLC